MAPPPGSSDVDKRLGFFFCPEIRPQPESPVRGLLLQKPTAVGFAARTPSARPQAAAPVKESLYMT